MVTQRPICAVAIYDGASLTGPVIQIPRGAKLKVGRRLSDARLIDVHWNDRRYAVFAVDVVRQASGGVRVEG